MLTCDFKYAPDCEGFAEVAMATPGIAANVCLPCGKAFQKRFPHSAQGLSIFALPENINDHR